MRPRGSAEELEARRVRAVAVLEHSLTPSQVAERIGLARQTVQQWRAWVPDGGQEALHPTKKIVQRHLQGAWKA
jgi:transposase